MQSKTNKNDASSITNWREISPLEYYMKVKSQDESAKWEEINKCAICMCEVFDEIQIDKKDDA